ncbi:MAG: DUF1707 domain-containing protein [Actinomycetes bacterium]
MTLEPRRFRIGDAERAQTEQVLSEAYAEGRLTHTEYSQRSSQALAAVYAGDLDGLVVDLVRTHPSEALALSESGGSRVVPTSTPSSGIPVSFAFMSGTERAGDWTVASSHVALAFMGGVDVDLREARFASNEVSIVAVAIMGGIRIVVPPDVRVRIQGLPLMGGFGSNGRAINPDTLPPDAPVVTVTGLALMGGVGVERLDYGERAG